MTISMLVKLAARIKLADLDPDTRALVLAMLRAEQAAKEAKR